MKAKSDPESESKGVFPFITTAEFHRRSAEGREKFRRMTKAQKRGFLIEIGALTPEGSIPVFPMNHVPMGPRE